MIYVTGDCHREFNRFDINAFPEQKEMTKEDYVIICGDFGGIWDRVEESNTEKWWLDWLEQKSFTTLFVDGNHENFDRLSEYPIETRYGGKVHKIRNSVLHLMRGQVFGIDGKKIFAFGGARSHDIDGGILELDDPDFKRKRMRLESDWISYRINHLSWWADEMPSKKEMYEGLKNLEKHQNTVDFIVTHCCASSTQIMIGGAMYKPDELTAYFEDIRQNVKFKNWFFGHYHDNKRVSTKELLLYEQIIRVW